MENYQIYGKRSPEESDRERANRLLARRTAAEGMVLLKNEGVLPLKQKRIALYGAGARKTVCGGTGSGDMHSRRNVSIERGLKNAGYEIPNSRWLDRFDRDYDRKESEWRNGVEERIKDYTIERVLEMFEVIFAAEPFRFPVGDRIEEGDLAEGTDTAVYVIARQAGEGADRKLEQGDFLLDETERYNLEFLTRHYEKVLAVINCGGMMDLTFLDELPGIKAVLFYGQGGTEGGNAFGDLVSGKVTPSGKLADTWAMKYDDYPSAEEFLAVTPETREEDYPEGIYVGYRYFKTYGVKPRYSFGYGLSYTSFSFRMTGFGQEGRKACLLAEVTNTGTDYTGKEVLQAYVARPWGRLDHEAVSLVGFAKTDDIAPLGSAKVEIAFELCDLASYDEEAAEWFLEKGEYGIYLGTSAEEAKPVLVLSVEEETVIEKNQNICKIKHPVMTGKPQRPALEYDRNLPRHCVDLKALGCRVHEYEKPMARVSKEIRQLTDSLYTEELASLCTGGGQFGKTQHITPGAVGWTTMDLAEKGIPNVNFADGPAGLRLVPESVIEADGTMKYLNALPREQRWGCVREMEALSLGDPKQGTPVYQYMTAWPAEHVQAQTWNRALLRKIGEATGREMLETGVALWLAPAMNIHRNPLCGRNFEYYSEDPCLSARMAAAVTEGVQSHPGIGVTVKHFCCNNRETNRQHISENMSERTLREIYLRGFRYVVENARPKAIMSSYNRVNGEYVVNSYDLLVKVLRCEWGYEGLVMSDWGATGDGKGKHALAPGAGNDLIMPGGADVVKGLIGAFNEGRITREELEWSASHVLNLVYGSAAFKSAERMQF